MKKYLMTGIAALALCVGFTSCSHDLEQLSQEEIDELNAKKIVDNYNKAFIATFGQPAADQNWGFGPSATRTRSGNTSGDYESYPATHTYTDASGKVIAGANMNHNEWGASDKEFGGWIVPDPLTPGQKERVRLYFQANPNLSYQDPHYANFYVQQVYTGGTSAPTTGNKEATVGADGQAHKGMTLNQLTVGQACSHINDFNAGTCTTSSVLNHEGKTQNDEITLMVNVDDTSCFGFHETSGSNTSTNNQHNDKMALVSAATIDAWAAANGNPGEAVVDKWNRSFMGFDYELLPESDIVTDSYAMLSNWDGNLPEYAWDGTDVMVIGSAPEATEAEEVDITSTFAQNTTGSNVTCSYDSNGNIVCIFTGAYYNNIIFAQNANWAQYDKLVIEFAEPSPINATLTCDGNASISVGDTKVEVATVDYAYSGQGPNISNNGIGVKPGTQTPNDPLTLTIKSVKLVKEATAPDASTKYYTSQYLLAGGTDQISFYSTNTNMYGGVTKSVSSADMTTTVDGKTCINLKWIKEELLDKGYHPITSDLKTWVKWQAACDGYYSDWIVTLTEAKRQDTPPTPPTPPPFTAQLRIMAEDLSATEKSDYDFNDIVFDVQFSTATTPAKILVRAAGGTLPLRIKIGAEAAHNDDIATGRGWQEVHALWNKSTGIMINTNADVRVNSSIGWDADYDLDPIELDYDVADEVAAKGIIIEVLKSGQWLPMNAEVGMPAAKFACTPSHKWAEERQSLSGSYTNFEQWVQGKVGVWQWY